MALVCEGRKEQGLLELNGSHIQSFSRIDCVVHQNTVHQDGTLYLSPTFVVFVGSEGDDYSLVIDCRAIGVHAICHSTDIYKRPCIYCQLSDPSQDQWRDVPFASEDGFPEDDSTACFPEVLFSPESEEMLSSLFEVLSCLQTDSSDEASEDLEEELAFDCNIQQLYTSLLHVCEQRNDFVNFLITLFPSKSTIFLLIFTRIKMTKSITIQMTTTKTSTSVGIQAPLSLPQTPSTAPNRHSLDYIPM